MGKSNSTFDVFVLKILIPLKQKMAEKNSLPFTLTNALNYH
jgi:hypothetical protein